MFKILNRETYFHHLLYLMFDEVHFYALYCLWCFKLFPLKKKKLKITLRKSIFDTNIENYLDNIETCLAASFYELINDDKQT